MNCPNCGQPIDPGASFCGNCGQSTIPVPTTQPQSVTVNPQAVMPDQVPNPLPPTSINAYPTVPLPAPVGPIPTSPATNSPQVIANQPITPIVGMPMGSPQPAYALPQQQTAQSHRGETKAIIGLVVAVLGIPGSLIPILGLALGVTGLVIGTMSRRIKRGIGTASIVIGIIAILLSLGLWTYAIVNYGNGKKIKQSSVTQDLLTPCYSAKLSTTFHIDNASGSCKLNAYDGATRETSTSVYSINGVNDGTLNESNFEEWAQKSAPDIISAASTQDRKYTLTSQKSGMFAGKQAHIIIAESNQNTQVQMDIILYNAPNGDNIFIVASGGTGKADMPALEKNFSWK